MAISSKMPAVIFTPETKIQGDDEPGWKRLDDQIPFSYVNSHATSNKDTLFLQLLFPLQLKHTIHLHTHTFTPLGSLKLGTYSWVTCF